MENTLIFASEKEVRFGKLLKFIIPTYLTSLFNTVYTIIDGIFVSAYVGTNALAAINIVYPIVNVLTGIALVFATGGSAVAALHIGGNRKEEANHAFSVSSPSTSSSRNCARSLASCIEPGRIPSPSDSATSYFATRSQISSKWV